ncbi:MAG: ATPase domain-containing protein [Candidatus Caldarchaeum sp.]
MAKKELPMYVSTGIAGLDTLLDGKGFPASYNIVVMGSPGSGKTTFGLQFLHHGCKIGENGVYVTLDENPEKVLANARNVGLDLQPFLDEGLLAIVDASPIRTIPGQVKIGGISIGKKDFSLTALIAAVTNHVRNVNAKRLVIDSLTSFFLQYPRGAERRTAFMELLEGITPLGCTTLLLTELRMSGSDRIYQFEEYLADGVVILRKYLKESAVLQSIQIEKMRGVSHNVEAHPYRFVRGGIEVFPTEKVI